MSTMTMKAKRQARVLSLRKMRHDQDGLAQMSQQQAAEILYRRGILPSPTRELVSRGERSALRKMRVALAAEGAAWFGIDTGDAQ